jgi:hypothetical protein
MAAQTIRDTVTMEEILGLYGYQTRMGFMCCPFHGEKEPSLKVYPKSGGWHCFGCERGGSVIDFVKEHEGCDFRTAVIAIDRALHLDLMDPHEDPEEARQEARIQKKLDDFVDSVYSVCELERCQIEIEQKDHWRKQIEILTKKDRDPQELTAKEWTFLLAWNDEEDYYEYRKEKIKEFTEGVAAWRRKARKAQSAS